MAKVIVYTKAECCLCDEALEVIERVRRDHDFELAKVDIAADRTLEARYGERIPVVLVDGVEAFQFHVRERELRERVGTASGALT